MLNKQSYFNLINAANITSGLLEKNLVKSKSELEKFKDTFEGLPILIAADHKIFSFSKWLLSSVAAYLAYADCPGVVISAICSNT